MTTQQKARELRSKHWQSGLRYYVTTWGALVEVWQNECGCHPFDATITSLDHKGKKKVGYSYSFRNQQHLNAFVRTKRWERLK